ncbi:hypothetical protein MNBD_GAMMA12-3279 [hydrothermal vent metagenome]|uniref:Uncharacterized protein n=1 Tax=hydrothermal vent metagenome TaxID=652676 RepID=A0A3B0Z0M5_9ZZZZ
MFSRTEKISLLLIREIFKYVEVKNDLTIRSSMFRRQACSTEYAKAHHLVLNR